jgi:polyferredoxin
MKPYESLSSIPVKVVTEPAYHGKRRITQIAALLVLAAIPVMGLFRIDLQAGNFVILGRQVWWSDYSLMLGFWIMLATAAAMTYSTIGTVWCGWACPQNSLSELTNYLTAKLLGKRAGVHIDSSKTRVAAAKNKIANWTALGLTVLLISAVIAVIPFLYLYPAGSVWDMLTFRPDLQMPRFSRYLYLVAVFAVFLDIALIRNVLCGYFCLYRIWQHIFKTKQTLHVEYDAARSSDCAKCNYCRSACFLGFDPTAFRIYDTCINCGDCIDACNERHGKEGARGLLKFEFGERRRAETLRDSVDNLFARLGWAGAIFIAGGGLFVWGVLNYAPYDLVASRVERTADDYRIRVSNKRYAPMKIALSVKGLPEGSYRLDADTLDLTSAANRNVGLHIATLPKGLHRVIIEGRAEDGRVERFIVEHFATGN